jgi:hypothetical protein
MIELWHGGSRWTGDPEIRGPRKGCYEAGPGLYFTTSYLRASSYAKGGNVVTRVGLSDDITWLEDHMLPAGELLEYVKGASRLPRRQNIAQYLEENLHRQHWEDAAWDKPLYTSVLVNLCVNEESLGGSAGVELARWLSDKGIDASLHKQSASEHWVVVFNPKVIEQYKVVKAADVKLEDRNLPLIQPRSRVIEDDLVVAAQGRGR